MQSFRGAGRRVGIGGMKIIVKQKRDLKPHPLSLSKMPAAGSLFQIVGAEYRKERPAKSVVSAVAVNFRLSFISVVIVNLNKSRKRPSVHISERVFSSVQKMLLTLCYWVVLSLMGTQNVSPSPAIHFQCACHFQLLTF